MTLIIEGLRHVGEWTEVVRSRTYRTLMFIETRRYFVDGVEVDSATFVAAAAALGITMEIAHAHET